MIVAIFQLDQAESMLLEALANLFAAHGAARAEMRRRVQFQIARYRTIRRAFYGSHKT